MVVIAIISLLVSILLPSLNKAKELARAVTCLSTLRSGGMACVLYAEDYDTVLPLFCPTPSWQGGWWTADKKMWFDLLADYGVSVAAGNFHCPAEDAPLNMNDFPYGLDEPYNDGPSSIGYNAHYNLSGSYNPEHYYPQSLEKLNHPDQGVILADSGYVTPPPSVSAYFQAAVLEPSTSYFAWRHPGGLDGTVNAFMADLSAQAWDVPRDNTMLLDGGGYFRWVNLTGDPR